MQNIEHDMDDLFKRAADEYPLNAGHGDWESIEKRLAVTEPLAATGKPEKKNNKKLFLLLLLIVLSSLIGFMILIPGSKNYFINKSSTEKNLQTLQKTKAVATTQLNKNTVPAELHLTNTSASTEKKKEAVAVKILAEKNKIDSTSLDIDKNKNIDSEKAISQFLPDRDDKNDENNINNFQKNNKPEPKSTTKYSKVIKDSLLSENEKVESATATSGNNEVIFNDKKKTKPKKKNRQENGVYAGLLVGLDFSKVKSTSFKGPGYGAGILIGYKAKSFFVETGISREFKYYLSMGQSFNDHDAPMPSGMVIENLESRSRILEIPLKVGYTFYKKKKNSLFIAGGAAIYIMTNEKNNYNVTMNGNPEKMVGLYEKNNVKFPAVVSISAGWEHNLNKSFQLRIEPILKLPLKGIGIGRLPVTSAGLQLGVTKKIN
ncbi:MAG: hypothetical protein ABIP35_16375 [Ginsengibacter sp.]